MVFKLSQKLVKKVEANHTSGKNCDKETKRIVFETLACFPKKDIDYVNKHVWFVGHYEDFIYAVSVDSDQLKHKQVVLICENIKKIPIKEARYLVGHEIAHIVLGHTKIPKSKTNKRLKEFCELEATNYSLLHLRQYGKMPDAWRKDKKRIQTIIKTHPKKEAPI